MGRHLWLVIGMLGFAACSNGRERQVAVSEDETELPELTLPDTVAGQDTTPAGSSADQPVSSMEQEVASPESAPPPKRRPARQRSKPRSAVASRPAPDTSVRAYAPSPPSQGNPADTARSSAPADTVDTVSSAAPDSAAAAPPDSAAAASDTAVRLPDSVTRPDSLRAAPDTIRAPSPDTTRAASADTTGAPSPDTSGAAPPDTISTANADPMVAPRAASARDLAARTVAVGTEIHAALDDSITSRRDTVGHQVSAHVMENVVGPDGRTLIAAGTPVRLTIARLRPSRSKGSQGRFALRADSIALNGQLQPVKAELRPVPRELRGRGVTGSEVAKVGGGAAAGAVIGGVIGGNTKGAVIGGVAGAAAGAAVASQTTTRDVVVKAKTPLVLILTEPLVVPETRP